MKSFTLLLALGVGLPLALRGAGKPNLSGTWKLDPLRSRFESLPAPKSGLLKIEHQEPKIHIAVDMATKHGESTETLDLTTDGSEQKLTIDGRPATADAYWEDDGHLMVEVKRDTPDGPEVETQRMHVDEKGKMMTTVLTLKDATGQKSAYEFYVKE